MSNEARPISPSRFASALADLPLANLYSKAFEIRNSIAHLQRSNEELQAYSDSQPGGDEDCLDAVRENEMVIARMRERVGLVKREVENRGGRWHEAEIEVDDMDPEHTKGGGLGTELANGVANGNQGGHGDAGQGNDSGHPAHLDRADNINEQYAGGTLNDEELRRRMLERMGQDDDDDGMHL